MLTGVASRWDVVDIHTYYGNAFLFYFQHSSYWQRFVGSFKIDSNYFIEHLSLANLMLSHLATENTLLVYDRLG